MNEDERVLTDDEILLLLGIEQAFNKIRPIKNGDKVTIDGTEYIADVDDTGVLKGFTMTAPIKKLEMVIKIGDDDV